MKKQLVRESFNDIKNSGKNRHTINSLDEWVESDMEIDDMITINRDNKIGNIDDERIQSDDDEYVLGVLRNEMKNPESSRGSLEFKNLSTGEDIIGVPMAEIGHDAFIFKIDGKLKKINTRDIKIDD